MSLNLNFDLDRQNDSAVLDLSRDNKLIAKMVLDADHVDLLIAKLAEIREKLAKKVPANPPPNIPLELNPRWFIEDVTYADGIGRSYAKLLTLRERGLGWIGYVLPTNEAHNIAQYLVSNPAGVVRTELPRDREAGPVSEGSSIVLVDVGFGTGSGSLGGHGL